VDAVQLEVAIARQEVQRLYLEQRRLERPEHPGAYDRIARNKETQIEVDIGEELQKGPVAVEEIAQRLVT
jgi:hypothetical protein